MGKPVLNVEHEQLAALYRHWTDRREGNRLPSRDSFDVMELQPWMGHLILIAVIDGGQDFLYRLHGTTLVGIVGQDLTGRLVSGFTDERRRAGLMDKYRYVVQSGDPLFVACDSNPDELNYKSIRKLILPLSDNGREVDMLLVGCYGEVDRQGSLTDGGSFTSCYGMQISA